jgi:hypothetical protein
MLMPMKRPPRWSGWKCVTSALVIVIPSVAATFRMVSMSQAASMTAASRLSGSPTR